MDSGLFWGLWGLKVQGLDGGLSSPKPQQNLEFKVVGFGFRTLAWAFVLPRADFARLASGRGCVG